MFLNTIALDAAMSVEAVFCRLAHYGLWLDPQQTQALSWINDSARRVGVAPEMIIKRFAHDPNRYIVAIRRQWNAQVLWYSRSAQAVLVACAKAAIGTTLKDALQLHETDADSTLAPPLGGRTDGGKGIFLDGGTAIGVSTEDTGGKNIGLVSEGARSRDLPMRADKPSLVQAEPPQTDIRAWPRLDAPGYSPASVPFTVVVGLSARQREHITGGEIRIPLPEGSNSVDLTVNLIADGVDAPDGWSRVLHIERSDPTASSVTFVLVGRVPLGPEPVHLTTLEVQFVVGSAVRGSASRPMVIGPASQSELGTQPAGGIAWLAQPATAAPLYLESTQPTADLTIEIAKPDRNTTQGRYVVRLLSPHPIQVNGGPYDMDLGQDAKTFAGFVVEQVRQFSSDQLVDHALRAIGDLVAEKLPTEVFTALAEVAQILGTNAPTVLIVSADPYVPWELARMKKPLDAKRPSYLGAQTIMGRWLRDSSPRPSPGSDRASPVASQEKPQAQPPAQIDVRHMAVMVGLYQAGAGLRSLPGAEKEGDALVAEYGAIALPASTMGLKQLLDAQLSFRFEMVGADAVHFAGHGDFDPARPDASVLFLSNGKPMSSLLFRSANYGGTKQPLLFLNACMIGIGGELLGDMGGFPGNCLRGGFGAVLGALWEVDDSIASTIAVEFWRQALPLNEGHSAKSVGSILRDLRSKYLADDSGVPISTYLSYVYYGHPLLKLQRLQ